MPVSTRTRPSGVLMALTLANAGTKATPSQISVIVPACMTGWNSLVRASPRHSLSASARMSVTIGSALPCQIIPEACIPRREVCQRSEHHHGASRPQVLGSDRADRNATPPPTGGWPGRHDSGRVADVNRRADVSEHGSLLWPVPVREYLVR